LIDEFTLIYPLFQFEIRFQPEDFDDQKLRFACNRVLIKQAFANVLDNAIKFSENQKARIIFDCSHEQTTKIKIINRGTILNQKDKKYLFQHFFRGKHNPDI